MNTLATLINPLSHFSILSRIREQVNGLDPNKYYKGYTGRIPIIDHMMTALAIFSLKCPSLLDFTNKISAKSSVKKNIKHLYSIKKIPSDTYLRSSLDQLNPSALRPLFTDILSQVRKEKCIESYKWIDGKYLIAIDGVQFFSSKKICCPGCCVKCYVEGEVTYSHGALGAVIVCPGKKIVIPLCPEPISNEDGSTKNDCEANATKRLIPKIREENPDLQAIVLQDSLSANNPNIDLLEKYNLGYLTVAKEGSLPTLFQNVRGSVMIKKELVFKNELVVASFLNNVQMTKCSDRKVNFFDAKVTNIKTGIVSYFSFITSVNITQKNISQLLEAGRSRWKIENETFNTLKNQDYKIEHNFGHGENNLATILMMSMFLQFLIDQVLQLACPFFQAALRYAVQKKNLWSILRGLFMEYIILSWEDFYMAVYRQPPERILSFAPI